MNALKKILTIFIVLAVLLISIPFVIFAMQPFSPEKIIKISDKDWTLETEFHELTPSDWAKINDKLVYLNKTDKMGVAKLKTALIPSEEKKPGYITSSVITNGKLAMLPKNGFIGFQIGEAEADKANQILMGINGKGEVVVTDGNKKELVTSIKTRQVKEVKKETKLSFHYYVNPYGWIIFFTKEGGGINQGVTINHIPYSNLNHQNKELSLVVYNPTQEGNVWFKNWEIQNDWTPND